MARLRTFRGERKVHRNGKAVVIKRHKELAELYEESLRSEGLLATIEPD